MQKILNLAFCSLLLFGVVACSPVVAQRGNYLENYQISDVKPGTHSQSDVLRILGSPTTQSTFDNNVWYYIGQETAKHGILDDKVTKERILVITFNDEGIVSTINEMDDPERLDVPYARGKTPTHGNDLTFMQQLLGNLGRFNAPQSSATDY